MKNNKIWVKITQTSKIFQSNNLAEKIYKKYILLYGTHEQWHQNDLLLTLQLQPCHTVIYCRNTLLLYVGIAGKACISTVQGKKLKS